MAWDKVWRDPAERTEDYPGLVVWDARVSGSVTLGDTRLPVWAPSYMSNVEAYSVTPAEAEEYEERLTLFLHDLLEQRGEFARLLCVLADVERKSRPGMKGWWDVKRSRRRVVDQLYRCLDSLGSLDEPQ